MSEPTGSGEEPGRYQSLRGMRDILPEDIPYYRMVEDTFWRVAGQHGFSEIRTPVLESTDVFVRPLGESSDVVGKEMYTFDDKSGHSVTLRPEGTAGVTRAYLEHGLFNRPQPVKLGYVINAYRYERPQAGRWREHEQFGLEVFGSADPGVDAQLILAGWQIFRSLGLGEVKVQINSIGEEASRKAIRKVIVDALTPVADKLSADAKRQLKQNPLRILDSKDPDTIAHLDKIPPLIDQLTKADREHFTAVLEYLDQVEVPYELNPRLVRGFDYYTRTVFEFWGSAGGGTALGGGGRYDRLVGLFGGPDTPAIGFASGVDRIVVLLKEHQGTEPPIEHPQVFVVQLGDVAKKISFELVNQLTEAGISVTSAPGRDSIRSQLKLADKEQVPLALIIGQKEAMEGSIIIRDMTSGMQDTVALADVVATVQKRIPSQVKKSAGSPSESSKDANST